ncbi:hypothetical protein C2G38_2076772 [Gigaspora rosea]|uniref:Uncharacterized protein n=1 Tax=Gigaspora rosea TaxID=44941 RepID=A0A397VSE2_9GLOM|nr:hypothetical protein C2G38_2076772 [Gigaspora rosea]
MDSSLETKKPLCLFTFIAQKDPNSKAVKRTVICKTDENQKWRNACAPAALKRLTELAKYFPELTLLLDSIKRFSLCEHHYNQIVAKNSFIDKLKKAGEPVSVDSGESERKRSKLSNVDNDDPVEKTFVDFGAQVNLLEKTSVDFGSQVSLQDPTCEMLLNKIEELENFNRQLLSENEELRKRLDERFTDRQERINSVIEIAKKERSSLYEDIVNLIKGHERFSLGSLLEYSPSKWLAERNPVIDKFIETLTYNDKEHQHEGEKLFKCAVAVDAIYESRHLKYVSAINLVASAVKYSLARSKMVVDIDNHIISSGSYKMFVNWLEGLAIKQPPLPGGFLFLAFDNEQKGQKNYLDRGSNTVVFHTVKSFIALNHEQYNNIQNTDPWLCSAINQKQYEELFYLISGMENEIHEELTNYLSTILEKLLIEKNQETNTIDELVYHQSQIGYMKKCTVCQTSNIDNKKRNCPTCHNKLLTISEINKQFDEPSNITNIAKKSLDISPYAFEEAWLTPENEVYMPQLFVPDPIGINPNSVANIQKVLEHIEKISGVKNGSRKWVVVTCDGVPYHHIQKIKSEFPWLILIPGALHEEMNMLRAFVELNWDVDIRNFAHCQGYRSDNQLRFFKNCSDHQQVVGFNM